MRKLTAEEFLREKLASEISSFGDGTTEFHTRDIQHLLECLDQKDAEIKHVESKCAELISKVDFKAEVRFKAILEDVMTKNNLSAEERLYHIRNKYEKTWQEIKPKNGTPKQ